MIKHQRGDTLVEVLLSVAVLSLVIAGSSVIMSNGMGKVQGSLERTQVQAEMDSQISALRAARAAAIEQVNGDDSGANWAAITSQFLTTSPAQAQACSEDPSATDRFYFSDSDSDTNIGAATLPTAIDAATPVKADLSDGDTQPIPGNGVWVEAFPVKDSTDKVIAYDFYVKACWDGYGSDVTQEEKTVVRLYAI